MTASMLGSDKNTTRKRLKVPNNFGTFENHSFFYRLIAFIIMISRYLLAFSFCVVVFITYHSGRRYVHGNSFGAPFISGRGFTNSPFDGRACNAAGCHTGTLNSGPGTVEISTDIPGEGYRAGTTYNITATIIQNNIKKFGFQMTSEDDNHNKAGRFIANAMTRVHSDYYITQGTNASASAGNNRKSWYYTRIAPMSPGT